MSMRVKILFILLFFIQSRIAHGINIHYCGNLVADLSYLHNAEGCNMHNSKSDKDCHISQKTCCLDKVLVYDKNQIENESISFSLFNYIKDQFISKIMDSKVSKCFNALHGSLDENGSIPGLLNCLKIPYTHSGIIANTRISTS